MRAEYPSSLNVLTWVTVCEFITPQRTTCRSWWLQYKMFSVFNTVLVLLASLSVFPSTYFQFNILKKSLSLAEVEGLELDSTISNVKQQKPPSCTLRMVTLVWHLDRQYGHTWISVNGREDKQSIRFLCWDLDILNTTLTSPACKCYSFPAIFRRSTVAASWAVSTHKIGPNSSAAQKSSL